MRQERTHLATATYRLSLCSDGRQDAIHSDLVKCICRLPFALDRLFFFGVWILSLPRLLLVSRVPCSSCSDEGSRVYVFQCLLFFEKKSQSRVVELESRIAGGGRGRIDIDQGNC